MEDFQVKKRLIAIPGNRRIWVQRRRAGGRLCTGSLCLLLLRGLLQPSQAPIADCFLTGQLYFATEMSDSKLVEAGTLRSI